MPTDRAKPFPLQEIQGPDYRPTGQMPAALKLERLVEESIAIGKENRDAIQTLADGQIRIAADVATLKAESEQRARKHSGGIARVSENDSKQDAAIAVIVTDVANLKETQATQLAILQRLDKVAANPMVRRVAYAVGAAVLGYLAAKGYR